ncbi:MAG: hypothetical protein E6I89_07595 [Chloroflexi bacterium]|nr:MAG: hypothetical protein E6I89_07595 [Chloroflexota bacterium]
MPVEDGAFDAHQRDVLAAAERRGGPAHLSLGALPRADADRAAGIAAQVRGQLLLGEDAIDHVLLDHAIVAVR